MKTTTWVACLSLATTLAACTGDNEDLQLEVPDASTKDTGASPEASTTDDAASEASDAADAGQVDGDASADAATADATSEADATTADALVDASADTALEASTTNDGAATSDGSPSDSAASNDSTVIPNDGAAADAAFQLTNATGTNLISSANVSALCSVTAPAPAGTYVMTCTEHSANGCRTIEVTFARSASSGPATGDVFVASTASPPGVGQAVVRFGESATCSATGANTWSQATAGGDLTITLGADTAFDFTLHAVGMGPAPVGSAGAQGTFTLTGNGRAYGIF
jgi:hypothetical protein